MPSQKTNRARDLKASFKINSQNLASSNDHSYPLPKVNINISRLDDDTSSRQASNFIDAKSTLNPEPQCSQTEMSYENSNIDCCQNIGIKSS